MANHLTAEQVDHFREVFSVFDQDGSGSIDVGELGACLRALGQNLTDEELKDLITSVDQDNSGTIDFDEFLALIVSKSEAINCEEELLAAFQEFDLAKKGKITKDQFYYIFCGMAETCEQQEIDYMLKLFGAVDENDEVAYPIVVNKLLEI